MASTRNVVRFLRNNTRSFNTTSSRQAQHSYRFVVVGGGAGGLAVASTLSRRFGKGATAIVEPCEVCVYSSVYCAVLNLKDAVKENRKHLCKSMFQSLDLCLCVFRDLQTLNQNAPCSHLWLADIVT